VARTEERFHEIRLPVSIARDAGLPSEIVDRERIRELWPSVVVDDLVGGVRLPRRRHDQPGPGRRSRWRRPRSIAASRYVPDTTVTGSAAARTVGA
jgi:hypothetical protein